MAINGGFQWHATLYVHPDAFRTRYVKQPDTLARSIGWAGGPMDALPDRFPAIVRTVSATMITDGVWVTGQIPRQSAFEDPGGPFFLDQAGLEPDLINDDQALYIESRKGLVVLLGCGHAGVVNTLKYVAQLTRQDHFHAVIGGMHLLESNEERIAKTITALLDYQVQEVAPVHCSGQVATAAIRQAWPRGFHQLSAGADLTIQ